MFGIKKESNLKIKLLVHLHLYYHDQLEYMLDKLSNISGCDWDLYVTVCEKNEKTENKILSFKPDAKIIQVENAGYDILPFLNVIKSVDLSLYDYVLKIHTKNQYKTELKPYKFIGFFEGYGWRNELINQLIGSSYRFKKNLCLMRKRDTGMICSKLLVFKRRHKYNEDMGLYDDLAKRLNVKTKCKKFLAGTMFIIKTDVLMPLVQENFSKEEFCDKVQETRSNSTLAHTIERIFIPLVVENNLKIRAVQNWPLLMKFVLVRIMSKIFSIKIKEKKNSTHRVITILGLSISKKI